MTTTDTTRTFKKGQAVIVRNDPYGIRHMVAQVRASTASWSSAEALVKLNGFKQFKRDYELMHADEVTPEMQAKFDKARAERDAEHAKAQRDQQVASDYERDMLALCADKLAAEPEVISGPDYRPDRDGDATGFVGFTIRYWVQRGHGLDTVVAQRDERVGVDIRRDWEYVNGQSVYRLGISMGGTTYTPFRARLMADAIQHALTLLPTLDPRPAYLKNAEEVAQ